MPEQPGLVPLLIARQAASGGVPLYPKTLTGSAQATAIQNVGRELRWGDVCQRGLVVLFVIGLIALAVAVVTARGGGGPVPAPSSSSGSS